jgi:hypothetical protein
MSKKLPYNTLVRYILDAGCIKLECVERLMDYHECWTEDVRPARVQHRDEK